MTTYRSSPDRARRGWRFWKTCPDVELVLVPVGGGGLSSGVAAAIKLSGSQAKVIGVEPALANDAQQSLRQGHVVRIAAEARPAPWPTDCAPRASAPANFEHLRTYPRWRGHG